MLSEGRNLVRETLLACVLGLHALAAAAETQPPSPAGEPAAAGADNGKGTAEDRISELEKEVRQLKELVRSLQAQMGQTVAATPAPATPAAPAATPATPATQATAPAQSGIIGDVLHGTTINALLDGYIAYNVDSPIGRVNSLRAYDVSSNSFSLNQADLIIENAPDLAVGKRFGMRIDLQYGQATSTLQGSPTNELRPEVYRNIFQAYGSYVFPVLGGLTVDFGKWASSLGIEGNYTKDQLNYSRSYWFDYLPFYHEGIRAKLAIDDQVAFNLWITNGTDQTEAFNNYKDQLYGIVVTPTPDISWVLNYYRGQEHPDVEYLTSVGPGQQDLPNEQGTYILPIANPPTGKLQIVDTYATWQVTHALQLSAEADYVQERLYSYSSPGRVQGGALYAGYQLTPQVAVAGRAEYMADIGGLYSGVTQYLKEGTFNLDYRPADGFLMRVEYRRDQSNRAYFVGHSLGVPDSIQPTVELGLVWWLGRKQGAW